MFYRERVFSSTGTSDCSDCRYVPIFIASIFEGGSDGSISSEQSASQTEIHLHTVKFAKLEKVSTCQWLNCGAVIANSVQGITLHLSLSHGENVAEGEDCVNCFWNDCCGFSFTGEDLVRHIRQDHLGLKARVCPLCNRVTSALFSHVREWHPGVPIMG